MRPTVRSGIGSTIPRSTTTSSTTTTTPTSARSTATRPSAVPATSSTHTLPRQTMFSGREAQAAASRSRLFGTIGPSTTGSTATSSSSSSSSTTIPRQTMVSRQTTTATTLSTIPTPRSTVTSSTSRQIGTGGVSSTSTVPRLVKTGIRSGIPSTSSTSLSSSASTMMNDQSSSSSSSSIRPSVHSTLSQTSSYRGQGSTVSTKTRGSTTTLSTASSSTSSAIPSTSSSSTTAIATAITSTTATLPRQRNIAPPAQLIPIDELSLEAQALIQQIQHLETEQINEKYQQCEEQCQILYAQLINNLNHPGLITTTMSAETLDDFQQRLADATHAYQFTLDQIQTQHQQYKDQFVEKMDAQRTQHQEEVQSMSLRSRQKLTDLNKRVEDLIQEGKQIAMDKFALAKSITTHKAMVNKRKTALESLTKNLTPQQRTEILDLRKQIIAVMKKRDLFESSKQDQMEKKHQFDEQTEQFIAAELFRRQLHNLLQEIRGSIRVLCRIRPLMSHDGESEYKTLCYEPEVSQLKLKLKEKEHVYQFDTILGPESTQFDVFDEVNGVVQSAIDGYDVCLFSYGQTGSGKTHTMTGVVDNEDHKGIIPRSVDLIFGKTHELSSQGWNFNISVSCCQIYQEKIYDLLVNTNSRDDKIELKIINDQANKKIVVTDLQIKPVKTVADVHQLLTTATKNRTVAQTSMNAQSSRSHFVFTLHVTMINTRTNEKRIGNLNLCDLAGSERVSTAKTTGEQFKETQKINLSLSTLNRVFLELASDTDHIPFRDSKLTDLLQYCLSGNGKTMMIVNLSPTASSAQETNGSLQLAKTVSMIQKGKNKSGVTKNGPKPPTIRKQPMPMTSSTGTTSQMNNTMNTTTATMSDDATVTTTNNNNNNTEESTITTGPSSNKNSMRSGLNEFKRVRVQPINIKSGDEDVDNELVCLDQYAETPAAFEVDDTTSNIFSTTNDTITNLQSTIRSIQQQSTSLSTIIDTLSSALNSAKELLPLIKLGHLNDTLSQSEMIDPTQNVYHQSTPQLDTFVAKYSYFRDKLTTLRNSIQSSTLELSRKGQTLQLDSLQLELQSHEEKVESVLLTAQQQLHTTTLTADRISNLETPLTTILTSLETAETEFKSQYETLSQSFLDEIDKLNLEYSQYFQTQREEMMTELQTNQRRFKDLYSTKYLAEIKALEKSSKLFNDVKQEHDELKQQYDLLDGQVKGLDFLKETSTNSLTPQEYIQQQRNELKQKREELVLLEQQCITYDDDLLAERRNKLSKYRHHNQQLEMKIAGLGGSNALMALMSAPKPKQVNIQAVQSLPPPQQQQTIIYNDEEEQQPSRQNTKPTTTSSTGPTTSSTSTSMVPTQRPKPLSRTAVPSSTNNIPTRPVTTRPIPGSSNNLVKSTGTTSTSSSALSRVTVSATSRAITRK